MSTFIDWYKFIKKNVPANFKNCVERTETEEITVLANKKGEVTRLVKKIKNENALGGGTAPKGVAEGNDNGGTPDPAGERPIPYKNLLTGKSFNKKKNYILPEGKSVPFLVRLGIMTAEGRVIAAKYDKFRQINRFLEIFKDAALEVLAKKGGGELSVVDFGSGKSYLTFAVQYFLTEILKVPCRIFGLDLKKDVIEYCSRLSDELCLKNLSFAVGDIAEFGEDKKPDIIITLHACDRLRLKLRNKKRRVRDSFCALLPARNKFAA
ncbi:methyltransferase [Treponema berlinense]|uniref:methyltransferase n=1 Tax=Treponema berlinense TaxID=225004 RepID=UPI0023575A85|nr:methyltransferase [Treponema berlinense]